MSDSSLFVIVLFILVVIGLVGFGLGFEKGLKKGFGIIRSTEFVVESADLEKATTNTGLVVENKGFNVGDTLVIIKK